jgi:hypothetical protein
MLFGRNASSNDTINDTFMIYCINKHCIENKDVKY